MSDNPATVFLAVTPSMRKRLAATCEALIALLDEIDGDENTEDGDQDTQVDDDRCDVPDSGDDEHELGWQEEGSQGRLQFGSDDECDLGTPEQINQVSRLKVKSGLMEHDGEPSLGWSGIGTGCRMGERTDDREHDAGDDREEECDAGAEDYEFDDERNCSIPGGGSVGQAEDGWRPDPNHVPPVKKQKKGKRPSAKEAVAIPLVLFRRDEAVQDFLHTFRPLEIWHGSGVPHLPPFGLHVLQAGPRLQAGDEGVYGFGQGGQPMIRIILLALSCMTLTGCVSAGPQTPSVLCSQHVAECP